MLAYLSSLVLTQMQLFLTSFMMVLTGETTSTGLDISLVESVLDILVLVVQRIATLFTIFPLNLFLILGIIGGGIGLFFVVKRGARK